MIAVELPGTPPRSAHTTQDASGTIESRRRRFIAAADKTHHHPHPLTHSISRNSEIDLMVCLRPQTRMEGPRALFVQA